jgi:hypothetical protein
MVAPAPPAHFMECLQHKPTLCEAETGGELVPPKVRELITDLQNAGFADRGGKAAIGTSCTPKWQSPSQYRVLLATMPSITRFELYAER